MRSRQRVTVVLAAAGGSVVLLVLWVASAAPVHVWHAPTTPAPTSQLPAPVVPAATAKPSPASTATHQQGLPPAISTAVLIAFAAALVALLVTMFLLREVRRRRRRRARTVVPPEVDAEEVLEVPEELARTVEEQLQALQKGSPRNAIVECWLRLEESVTIAGLAPDPAETSMELTRRVLARYAVAEQDLHRLSELYREARFSTHPLPEQHRDTAIAALAGIRAELAHRRPSAAHGATGDQAPGAS